MFNEYVLIYYLKMLKYSGIKNKMFQYFRLDILSLPV